MIRLRPSGADDVLIKRVIDWYDPGPGAFIKNPISVFSPLSLFAAGEVGAWYDPSDLTTLFQDSAGTTPVTAVEQPVGLMLDKSKGLALSNELFSTFSTVTSPWTSLGGGSWSINGTQGGNVDLSISPFYTIGTFYVTTFTLSGVSGGTVSVFTGDGSPVTLGNGTYTFRRYPSQVYLIFRAGPGVSATVSGVSVKSLAGNHAYQSTSAARPVLSARVNLLTKTEDLTNAIWVKDFGGTGAAPIATNAYSTAPDGTQTGIRLQFNRGAGTTGSDFSRAYQVVPANASGTGVVWAKSNTASTYSIQIGFGGAAVTKSITPTWTSFTVPQTGQADFDFILRGNIGSDATADISVWHPDVRVSNDGVGIPAYQRVNTSTDYDTTGFPLYIKPNGSSQFMVTNSINFSATDKMTVWAGVRKTSDASTAAVIELSANSDINAGSFYFVTSVTAGNYQFQSGGSSRVAVATSSYPAPTTNVFTGIGNISGDTATMRLNVNQVVTSTSDQGTGNYGNYPLYLFTRAGTSLWFGGRFYGLIVRGAASSAQQITQTETWMNGKTYAY